jgi:hypothetical protein
MVINGLVLALVFLLLNGLDIAAPKDELAEMMLAVARSEQSKEEVVLSSTIGAPRGSRVFALADYGCQPVSATDHAQQRTCSAHPNIVKRTQGLVMSRFWQINKNNDLTLKSFEIPNPCKANGMTIHVTG